MQLVESLGDILTNIKTLDKYLKSQKLVEKEFALSLIKRGTCFYLFDDYGEYRFFPSRFIGYKNNTMYLHKKNAGKDGRDTNVAISKIIGYYPRLEKDLEEEYIKFCKRLRFVANKTGTFGTPRNFWE